MMEAKDTGLYANEYDYGDLNDYGGGDIDWWHSYIRDINSRVRDHYQEQMDIQAEISFKAGEDKGRREVVEKSNQFIKARYKMVARDDKDTACNDILRDLQAKLKEWEIK